MWLAILILIYPTPNGPAYVAQPRFIENITTKQQCDTITQIVGESQISDPTKPFTAYLKQCFEMDGMSVLTVDEEMHNLIEEMMADDEI